MGHKYGYLPTLLILKSCLMTWEKSSSANASLGALILSSLYAAGK